MSNSREMYGSSRFWDVDFVSHCPMSKPKACAGSAGVTEPLLHPGSSCLTSQPGGPPAPPRKRSGPSVEKEVKVAVPKGLGKGEWAGGYRAHPRWVLPLLGCRILPRHQAGGTLQPQGFPRWQLLARA